MPGLCAYSVVNVRHPIERVLESYERGLGSQRWNEIPFIAHRIVVPDTLFEGKKSLWSKCSVAASIDANVHD